MVKPAVRLGLAALLTLIVAAAVVLAVTVWRLSVGPVPVNALAPAVERILAAQVEGGRARVKGVEAVWFGGERAAGLRLTGVSLTDGKGRPVLRASRVEAGMALDSALTLTPAAGRLAADDFFVAVSVSPHGRYALGYEAAGKPTPIKLQTLLRSLTGKPRRGYPVSYLRRLELDGGVILMRQVGGPVAWRGAVDKISFRKSAKRLTADTKLSIDDGVGLARIDSRLRGAVGLGELSAVAQVADLSPARVFPAVGFTRPLSKIDAPVQANGRLQYAANRGITSADVVAEAGPGFLRAGRMVQRLDGARLATRYDPAAKTVRLEAFHLDAERTRLDATGRAWLAPEKRGAPARVQFELASADSLLTIVPSAEPQPVTNAVLRGAYVPEKGRFEVADARMGIAGAPVRAWLLTQRGADPDASWAIKAKVETPGTIGPRQAAAFWPEAAGRTARAWFVRNIHGAQVSNFRLAIDMPAARRRFTNEMLRIDFDFAEAAASIAPTLPRIERGAGSAVVQGDRFDLTLKSGRLLDIALTEGSIEIPRFRPRGARATFKMRAVGDVGQMLAVVDRPPLRLISPSGMSPSRLAGRADMRLEITRPMLLKVPLDDYGVKYAGRWDGGSIRSVAGGMDLDGARMAVEGSLEKVSAEGVGRVGPYVGKIDFRSDLKGPGAGTKIIDLDGAVDVAGSMAGQASDGAPLKARVSARKGEGTAVIRSRLLDGRASWKSKRRVVVEGFGDPAAWRAAGVPVGPGLPARVPVKLALGGAGGGWSGALDADAYSGALAFTNGAVRYVADISPEEAGRLGLGDLPMFARTQRLVLEAGGKDRAGAADYAVGGMTGRVEWSPGKDKGALVYRFKTKLDRSDLAGLGVPFGPEAAMPVEATVNGARGGFAGQAQMAGATMRFNISPQKAGRRQIALSGEAPAATLVRLGLADAETIGGTFDLTGKLERLADGRLTGRLESSLERASLAVADSDWKKPLGRKGRLFVDLTARPDGSTSLDRIGAEGADMELAASATLAKGKLVRLDASTLRLEGLFDGAGSIERGERGMQLRVNGRFLDARPLIRRAQRPAARGGGQGASDPLQIDAALAKVRLTDDGYVKDLKASGTWGAADVRRMTIAASTVGGSALSARAWPDRGATALSLKAANLGDTLKSLGVSQDLRGGALTGTGRLVPGGYDLMLDVRDVQVARVPALAQLLTVASLQGLANTLGGTGIHFAHIEAPLTVRGSQVLIGPSQASGQALGLTAKGRLDLDKRTLDIAGVVAPAYALNSVAGALPLVGPLLISRDGEGLFGMTYSAKGSFDSPRVMANPLSLAAPGVLRRVFEGPDPKGPSVSTPTPAG